MDCNNQYPCEDCINPVCTPWPECSGQPKNLDITPGVKFHFHTLGNEPDMEMVRRSLVEGDEWIDYTPV